MWSGTHWLSNLSSFCCRHMDLFAVPWTCQACFHLWWKFHCLKFLSPRYPCVSLPRFLQVSALMSLLEVRSIIPTLLKTTTFMPCTPFTPFHSFFSFLSYLLLLNTIQLTGLLQIVYMIGLSPLENKFHKGRDGCCSIFQTPGRSPEIQEELKYCQMSEYAQHDV